MPGPPRPLAFAPLLLTLLAVPVQGQVVRGTVVTDAVAQRSVPVVGARVELRDAAGATLQEATTDSLGVFVFGGVRPGPLTLFVTHAAHLPVETDRFVLADEESLGVEVRLGQGAIPLEPLVVTARVSAALGDFHERRRRSGLGTYITRADIEARALRVTTDLLRGVPGVRLRLAGRVARTVVEMQGAFGSCQPSIFIDGLRMTNAAAGTLDDDLAPDRIEGVEVYTSISTVPAQFQTGTCGVILFWTRRGGDDGGKPWSWRRMLIGVGATVGLLLWIL